MKKKVIKNPKGVKKVNPRRKPIYVVKWEYGEQHFTDKKDAELYARLLKSKGRTVTVSEKKRNTAKPVAKANVARRGNPWGSKKTFKRLKRDNWGDIKEVYLMPNGGYLADYANSGYRYITNTLAQTLLGKRYVAKRNPIQRRSNSSREQFNREKLDDITREFQGREPNGKSIRTTGSDYTPNVLARLGKAVLMIVKNGKQKIQVTFGEKAFVGADARRNLYIEGADAAIKGIELPKKGNLTWLGEVQQLDYLDKKDHIENGNLVHYYHKLGEVDKIKPNAFVDHEGFTIIIGGNYDILPEGIAN